MEHLDTVDWNKLYMACPLHGMQMISVPTEKGKTMTDREKLIDLLDHATRIFRFDSWENTDKIADYLLSNGIRLESKQATSNENKRWIPVTENRNKEDNG